MGNRRGWSVGLGPVFTYEWITASRRWQGYALRVVFVGLLLAALFAVWWNSEAPSVASRRQLAELGRSVYLAVIGTQLTLVMLAAPAATAGAICLDRARGTLTHLMVTDLSDAEIVLGKLGSRLVPVLGLVACALPVLSLLSLLGGVDPDALLGAFLVATGVGTLGCALALTFSLWAGKTHEAVLGTYAVWCLWLLWPHMAPHLSWMVGLTLPTFPDGADPIFLSIAPYTRPGTVVWSDYTRFLEGTMALSAALAGLAVWRLRPVCNADRDRGRASRASRGLGGLASRLPRLPGPGLDGNPVLWREWHRSRPSRGARIIYGLYFGLAAALSATAVASGSVTLAVLLNALQVSIGLLLLSVTAAVSMAEERVRGSLDVLMATPLSTRRIVTGKWLGSFRGAPWLAVLPALVITLMGKRSLAENLGCAAILSAYVLAQGAFLTSLGLAMATWCGRLGRAVGLTVTIYVMMTVGWVFLIVTFMNASPHGFSWVCGSSPYGALVPTLWAIEAGVRGGNDIHLSAVGAWAAVYALAAMALLVATVLTFNRRLGRVENGLLFEWGDELEKGARIRASAAPGPVAPRA